MRKVLVSYGYGAGWTSWHSGSLKEKRFMFEYKPFIDYLEDPNNEGKEIPKSLQDQFVVDFEATFPDSTPPYMGGVDGLAVETFDDDCVAVRVQEYDGSESLVTSYDDWL